jgi:hypothetical protein
MRKLCRIEFNESMKQQVLRTLLFSFVARNQTARNNQSPTITNAPQ